MTATAHPPSARLLPVWLGVSLAIHAVALLGADAPTGQAVAADENGRRQGSPWADHAHLQPRLDDRAACDYK